ncbi:hypothetical protein ABIB14_002670 [Arthrobacter sp. UYEF3]
MAARKKTRHGFAFPAEVVRSAMVYIPQPTRMTTRIPAATPQEQPAGWAPAPRSVPPRPATTRGETRKSAQAPLPSIRPTDHGGPFHAPGTRQ